MTEGFSVENSNLVDVFRGNEGVCIFGAGLHAALNPYIKMAIYIAVIRTL
jgi:hypothetical protein